jgi:deazaflavin-dependent oxidoreductase (nitroreductase family)
MPDMIRKRFLWVLKHTLNRLTMRMARSRRGPFSLIRHVGRRSGRHYETPVILAKVPGGFVTELTYGPNVDWYQNVASAGHAQVIHHGREYVINGVSPYTREQGLAAFPYPARLVLRLTGRDEFRLLETSPDVTRQPEGQS